MPAQNLHKADEGGNYLHVFNKGFENRVIFRDEDDFSTFISFLGEYLSPPKDAESAKKEFSVNGQTFRGVPHQPKNYLGKIELLAYSLQSNNFRLLLHQKTTKSLQGLIRSLCTRYSMYFNKKYQRTGGLFEGPYKSVTISEKDLPILTRHLHKNGDHSSYQEYLKLKNTPWVMTKIVLSLKNGNGNYKDFVEKHKPSEEERELLGKIVIEKNDSNLERSNLARSAIKNPSETANGYSKKIQSKPNSNLRQKIVEFLGITSVFLVLFSIGARNVMISTNKVPESSALGIRTKISVTRAPSPSQIISTSSKSSTSSPLLKVEEPKTMLMIDAKDASASVNIRQEPTTNSKSIGKAKNGDTFEFVSLNSGWYGVKLASGSGSIGFISAEFVVEEHK